MDEKVDKLNKIIYEKDRKEATGILQTNDNNRNLKLLPVLFPYEAPASLFIVQGIQRRIWMGVVHD